MNTQSLVREELDRPRTRTAFETAFRSVRLLIGGYVDRVLRRVAARSDGWVTYFYTAQSIAGALDRIRGYAEEAGRDPDQLNVVGQVPLCIGSSYEEASNLAWQYVDDYFDVPAWSEATRESTVRGTPEQCAEQIAAYLDAGVKELVFCPYNYQAEQVYRLATEPGSPGSVCNDSTSVAVRYEAASRRGAASRAGWCGMRRRRP